MPSWIPHPYPSAAYDYDPAALAKHWARLHQGDAEPLPTDAKALAAWSHFHAGHFEQAFAAGLLAGGAGITAANKAQAAYGIYLETSEQAKLAAFMQVVERAEAQIAKNPHNANAHYLLAYALGRASQGVRIAGTQAQALGSKVKAALEAAIRLEPLHADAHVALGVFHAEVIDRVGSLHGRAYGASKDAGLASFKTALRLNPGSAIAMVEYANGLVMLEGEKVLPEANRLYQQAAACEPMDAVERLEVEMAKAELGA